MGRMNGVLRTNGTGRILQFVSYAHRRTALLLASCLALLALLYTNARYYRDAPADYRLLYDNLALVRFKQADLKCHLPRLDPYDQSITEFLVKPQQLRCKRLQGELTYVTEEGRLILNYSAIELEHYSTSIECEYRCLDKTNGLDDVTLDYGQWTVLNCTRPVAFTSDDACPFIDVRCVRSFPVPIPVYTNTHFRVIDTGKGTVTPPASSPIHSSVLLFVLDSVSHSNFIRNLPKTLNVLRSVYNATLFDGYTKVGDNSLPNAVAFLTGKRVAAAGYSSDLPDDMSQSFYDDWPFVWKEYAAEGFVTMYAEDYPRFNLFQYMSNGFKNRPVDHYFRPFWVHAWDTFLHRRSTHLCYGNTPKHRLQLDYLRRILRIYKSRRLFSFNWMTELGHDWMNQVNVADDDLAEFFITVSEYLKDTLFVVLSDHGHRFDPIRQTVIGRIEERMPFMAVALPSTWQTNQPQLYEEIRTNLKRNSKLLTSPFDLHATLVHYLSLTSGREDASGSSNGTRGVSLFRPLPDDRQCHHAHVPEEFCVCQQELHVANASDDEKVQRAALTVVDHLNQLLTPVTDRCSELQLMRIRHAQTFLPNLKAIEDTRAAIIYGGRNPSGFYINYRVTFQTVPGQGVFESAVRYSLTEDTFKVIGDVNRINKYGDQSACINSVLLRKYCYCLSNTNTTHSSQ